MRIRYEAGDLFAIVTDGVLERGDDPDPESSLDRIATLLRNNADASLPDLTHLIFADLDRCGKQRDDETVLLLRAREENKTDTEKTLSGPQRGFVKQADAFETTWRRLLDDLAEELSHDR
jgi:Stage II sporulation protein E (SpoIIE)